MNDEQVKETFRYLTKQFASHHLNDVREQMKYLPEFNRKINDRESYNLDNFIANFNRHTENSCFLPEPMLSNTTKEKIQSNEEMNVTNDNVIQFAVLVGQDINSEMSSALKKSEDELKLKNSSTNVNDSMDNANNCLEGPTTPKKTPIKRQQKKKKKIDTDLDKTQIVRHEFLPLPLQHLIANKIPGPLSTIGVSKNLTTQATNLLPPHSPVEDFNIEDVTFCNNETPVGPSIGNKVKSTKRPSTGATNKNNTSHMPLAYISSNKENVQNSTPNILNAKENCSNTSCEMSDFVNESCESIQKTVPFNVYNKSNTADIHLSKKSLERLYIPIVKKHKPDVALPGEQTITAEWTKQRTSAETKNKKDNVAVKDPITDATIGGISDAVSCVKIDASYGGISDGCVPEETMGGIADGAVGGLPDATEVSISAYADEGCIHDSNQK